MENSRIIKSSFIKLIQELKKEDELEIIKLIIAIHISDCLIKIEQKYKNLYYQNLLGKLFNNVFYFNQNNRYNLKEIQSLLNKDYYIKLQNQLWEIIYEITVICTLIDSVNGKQIRFYDNNNNPDIYIDNKTKINIEITTNFNKNKENQLKKFISKYPNDDFFVISSKFKNKKNLYIYGKEVKILKISDFEIFSKITNGCHFVNFILKNNKDIFSQIKIPFINNIFNKNIKSLNLFMEKINNLDLFINKSYYNISNQINSLYKNNFDYDKNMVCFNEIILKTLIKYEIF